MIDYRPTDGGARRVVLAQCDICKATDHGLVQTKPAFEDWPSPIPDLVKLGWRFPPNGARHYCSRSCADKHAYLVAQSMKQRPVTTLNDTSWRGPRSRASDPVAPAPKADPATATEADSDKPLALPATAKPRPRAPVAPRMSR